jgi:DNA ligase (NAD+)
MQFEHNGHHPIHAIAVKFKPPQLVSTVTEIEWKLQKTGKLVPIIHFKPITVDGRLIKKASGHNIEYLVKHDIVPGKTVQVILANDIIPQVKMQ